MICSILMGSAIILACYALNRFLVVRCSSSEPTLIPSNTPYVGHLLGMVRHGSGYYGRIIKKCNLPIYTLAVFRSKIYSVDVVMSIPSSEAESVSFFMYQSLGIRYSIYSQQHFKLPNIFEDGLPPHGFSPLFDILILPRTASYHSV
ncbi:hypothetical protein F4821DRAFT_178457 [Hypoxylon rubiginosum]|uniref:Uncharacterized protein n=1 Tax=Hypoxylon rubiginosum TaxID=110542 RepID=A0ACC0CV18_9PEZI|nr:hypothetical protein F4821DRAFT_178457 [Hypoxylon rubiginosum]